MILKNPIYMCVYMYILLCFGIANLIQNFYSSSCFLWLTKYNNNKGNLQAEEDKS